MRRTAVVVAGAVVTVAVTVAVVVISVQDNGEPDAAPAFDTRPFPEDNGGDLLVPAETDGITLRSVARTTPDDAGSFGAAPPLLVLGDPTATDPLEGPYVVVSRIEAGRPCHEGVPGLPASAPCITFRSRGRSLAAGGHDVDRDTLQLVARQVELEAGRAVVNGRLPDLVPLGALGDDWLAPREGVTTRVAFGADDGAMAIATSADQSAQVAYRAALNVAPDDTWRTVPSLPSLPSRRDLIVAGRRAFFGTLAPYTVGLVVPGSPGTVLLAPANFARAEELVRFAEALTRTEPAELARLARTVRQNAVRDQVARLAAEHASVAWDRTADGVRTVLLHDRGTSRWCIAEIPLSGARWPGAELPACIAATGDVTVAKVPSPLEDHSGTDVWGVASARVARVELVLLGGNRVEAPLVAVDEPDRWAAAFVLPAPAGFEGEVVAYDASGAEVARVGVTTGDVALD